MGLLSRFTRQGDRAATTDAAPPASADAVQQARVKARRRLIGAVVLLAIGVIGFPLLFETQPRPIPVDVVMELPRREGAAPLPLPAARPPAAAPARQPDEIVEKAADQGRELPAPTTPRAATPETAPKAAAEPPRPRPDAAKTPEKRLADDAARARALLEGQSSDKATTVAAAANESKPAEKAERFIVQVGAFADAGAVREARAKVEKLGLKTYTQAVETEGGQRVRVRVGPFGSRDEADKAAARLKTAGLPAAILAL
ncbi:SPOR domain-containing protein [Aquabacterium sp. J223]|uniref:SPOR domain-containing protein n=1 Tax=Aquabacterium sp. J223 TaxID=2898431 RepID=UPI0021AD894A|nr:SPOR domain-containing protein [Aquabacterium sp. J223]UUX94627.1 SPOR domain-containing protein [Aquabacterium sp. J223]